MVITSRLHVALPCLAFGTPVLLVRKNFDARFEGLAEHITKIDDIRFRQGLSTGVWEINGKKTAWYEIKNPNTHLEMREKLKALASNFVKEAKAGNLG